MTKTLTNTTQKEKVRDMIKRMMQAYDVDKKSLAKILGCQTSTVNNWVHFARVPYEQLVQCRNDTGKSLDWLMFGEHAMGTTLDTDEVGQLLRIFQQAIDGAVNYQTIQYCYPDSGEKLLNKLKKDLEAWNAVANHLSRQVS